MPRRERQLNVLLAAIGGCEQAEEERAAVTGVSVLAYTSAARLTLCFLHAVSYTIRLLRHTYHCLQK